MVTEAFTYSIMYCSLKTNSHRFRYKDNEKVEPTATRLVLDNSLFFLHVVSKKGDGGDTGTYYCLAKNAVGKVKSRNATLDVAREYKQHKKL